MIRIPLQLHRNIRAEGETVYPDECCGIMLGMVDAEGARTVTELQPMLNARESGERRRRFRIEADDILRAERLATGKGLEIIGFYHSHPDHPAAPSDYDREHALPWYAYIIVAVDNGRARRVRCWQLAGDRSRFLRERMHTLSTTDNASKKGERGCPSPS